MSNGQFWFGGNSFPGFLFKKNTGSGIRRATRMAPGGNASCNKPTEIWNKYKPGAGVGGNSIATRRAKMRLATSCNGPAQCGTFYKYLSSANYPYLPKPPVPVIEKTLIYTFYNTNNISDEDLLQYVPIITTNGKISFTIKTQVLNSGTGLTRVFVTYVLAPDYFTNLPDNDGLSFYKSGLELVTFYNDNSPDTVTIEQFDDIPLSRSGTINSGLPAGFQFRDLLGITFSATDKPTITSNTSLFGSFINCSNFNSPIGSWDVSNVTNMRSMFFNTSSFNQPINSWNTSNVTNMQSMFHFATVFNQPVGNWNTSNVTNMQSMFLASLSFNQPLSNWNTSNVTIMRSMFFNAEAFNQPINTSGTGSSWDVSNVTTMQSMFNGAIAFNQTLSSWDVSNVTTMQFMFNGATVFNQSLSSWVLTNIDTSTGISDIFTDATNFNNGEVGGGTSNELGIGWTNVTDYASPFRVGSALTDENAEPVGGPN